MIPKRPTTAYTQRLHDLAIVVAGGLHVLRDRIHLVERILLGDANPAAILCPENEAAASEEGPGIVPEWSPVEEEEHLLAQWRSFYRANLAQRERQFSRLLVALRSIRSGRYGERAGDAA